MNTFESRPPKGQAKPPKGQAKARAAHERDAALDRLYRTRRWVAGGATALTAAFAALVSTITPGHTASASATSTQTTGVRAGTVPATRPRLKMPPLASAGDLGLQAPGAAPQAAPAASQSAPVPSQSASSPGPSPSTVAPAPVPAPAPAAPAATSGGS